MHVIFIATSHRYHGLCEGRLNSFSSLLSKTKLYSQLASVRLRVILYYFYDVRTVSLVFFRRRTISQSYFKLLTPRGYSGAPNGNFRENICSEDDLRSRIFGAFVVKFLACLPPLGFSNIYKMV